MTGSKKEIRMYSYRFWVKYVVVSSLLNVPAAGTVFQISLYSQDIYLNNQCLKSDTGSISTRSNVHFYYCTLMYSHIHSCIYDVEASAYCCVLKFHVFGGFDNFLWISNWKLHPFPGERHFRFHMLGDIYYLLILLKYVLKVWSFLASISLEVSARLYRRVEQW